MEIVRVARDENNTLVGGASGTTYLSAVEVEVLWVDTAYRNQHIAARLLTEIEDEAQSAGCRLFHLTTYSFQAPQFYIKQGYTICGEVDGFVDGIKLFMLKNRYNSTHNANNRQKPVFDSITPAGLAKFTVSCLQLSPGAKLLAEQFLFFLRPAETAVNFYSKFQAWAKSERGLRTGETSFHRFCPIRSWQYGIFFADRHQTCRRRIPYYEVILCIPY